MAESNNGRMVLLLIAGLPLTMILAATWLWFYVERGDIDLVDMLGTANRGQLLVPPLPVADLGLNTPATGNAEWTILIPIDADCGSECEQLLYYTRQIRTAMGKYTPRIKRAAVVFDRDQRGQLESTLAGEHPELEFLYTPPARWDLLLQRTEPEAERPGYYVVDPQGWIMMSYLADADGKDVMADLKFLLKNSNG